MCDLNIAVSFVKLVIVDGSCVISLNLEGSSVMLVSENHSFLVHAMLVNVAGSCVIFNQVQWLLVVQYWLSGIRGCVMWLVVV